jgi:hypothetical protein
LILSRKSEFLKVAVVDDDENFHASQIACSLEFYMEKVDQNSEKQSVNRLSRRIIRQAARSRLHTDLFVSSFQPPIFANPSRARVILASAAFSGSCSGF